MTTVRIPTRRLTRKFFEHTFFPFGIKQRVSEKKNKTPGMHGKEHPKNQKHAIERFFKQLKLSAYGLRLRHKQILRFHYNVCERQLQRYVKQAKKSLGRSGETLVALLEMRLDTLVYRSCFAISIRQARQFVSHGHIRVNGSRVNRPSYACGVNDEISLTPHSPIMNSVKNRLQDKYRPVSAGRGRQRRLRGGRTLRKGLCPSKTGLCPSKTTGKSGLSSRAQTAQGRFWVEVKDLGLDLQSQKEGDLGGMPRNGRKPFPPVQDVIKAGRQARQNRLDRTFRLQGQTLPLSTWEPNLLEPSQKGSSQGTKTLSPLPVKDGRGGRAAFHTGRGGRRGGFRGGFRGGRGRAEQSRNTPRKGPSYTHVPPSHLSLNRRELTSKVQAWIKHEDTWVERQSQDNPAKIQLRFIIEYYNRG